MPQRKFTARFVESVKTDKAQEEHRDIQEQGLEPRVTRAGVKSWAFRYRRRSASSRLGVFRISTLVRHGNGPRTFVARSREVVIPHPAFRNAKRHRPSGSVPPSGKATMPSSTVRESQGRRSLYPQTLRAASDRRHEGARHNPARNIGDAGRGAQGNLTVGKAIPRRARLRAG